MHLRSIYLSSALVLLLTLSACGGPAGESPSPSPVSTVPASLTPAPTPTTSPSALPAPSETPTAADAFATLPVTEEAISSVYESEGYSILKLDSYQGDYLVWYTDSGHTLNSDGSFNDQSSFAWIFGETGRRVCLPVDYDFRVIEHYEILDTGVLRLTTGESETDGFLGFPATYTLRVIGGPDDRSDSEFGQFCDIKQEPRWLPLDRGVTLGMRDTTERHEVVYDVECSENSLTISFIPPASQEGIGQFIAASTTIPYTTVEYDAASGNLLLLRFTNTVLETGTDNSGDDSVYDFAAEYGYTYPHSFPKGALGEDTEWYTNAAISSNGTDTTLSVILPEQTKVYTVELGHKVEDMFPYLTIRFGAEPVD